MKASVVGWPIILIPFGQEAGPELAEGLFFSPLSQAPKNKRLVYLVSFNRAQPRCEGNHKMSDV